MRFIVNLQNIFLVTATTVGLGLLTYHQTDLLKRFKNMDYDKRNFTGTLETMCSAHVDKFDNAKKAHLEYDITLKSNNKRDYNLLEIHPKGNSVLLFYDFDRNGTVDVFKTEPDTIRIEYVGIGAFGNRTLDNTIQNIYRANTQICVKTNLEVIAR